MRLWIAAGCVLMAGIAIALWQYFGLSEQASFAEQAIVFDDTQLKLPPELAGANGRIRVVHFWDPACPCNVGNQQHLSELLQRFAEREVSFHVLRKAGSKGTLPAPLAALQPIDELPGAQAVGAASDFRSSNR